MNTRTNLIEVKPDTREAVFEKLDHPGETETFKVSKKLCGICWWAYDQ